MTHTLILIDPHGRNKTVHVRRPHTTTRWITRCGRGPYARRGRTVSQPELAKILVSDEPRLCQHCQKSLMWMVSDGGEG